MIKKMKKGMRNKNSNTDEDERHGHSHARHMWMMAIFCGVPIIGFLAIGISGISMPSVGFLFLIICAIGMLGMMVMPHGDSDGKEKKHNGNQSEKGANYETGK